MRIAMDRKHYSYKYYSCICWKQVCDHSRCLPVIPSSHATFCTGTFT